MRKILVDAKLRKQKRKNFNNLEIDKDNPLKGKLLIQMFEKSSLRTRLSFYLAIKQLGGGTLTWRANELHLVSGGETLEDTAKILSTYGDGFMLRTDKDKKLENFKKFLKIPVINGLSPSSHPTQVLSDVFTAEEIKKKPISKLNICWIGDSNNVFNTSSIFGFLAIALAAINIFGGFLQFLVNLQISQVLGIPLSTGRCNPHHSAPPSGGF